MTNIADLSARLDQQCEDSRAAAQQLLVMSSKVSALESQQRAVTHQLQASEAEARDLSGQLAGSQAAVEQLQGRVDTLTDTFSSRLGDRDQQLAAAAAERAALCSRLEAAEKLQAAAAKQQAALHDQVRSLRAVVARQAAARRVGQREACSKRAAQRCLYRALRQRVARMEKSFTVLNQQAQGLEASKRTLRPQVGGTSCLPASKLTAMALPHVLSPGLGPQRCPRTLAACTLYFAAPRQSHFLGCEVARAWHQRLPTI